jgi:hypothetical protein
VDANESDAVMLEVLGELRQLRPVLARLADTMVLVNQTCVCVSEAVGRLNAHVSLLQAGPAE